MGLYSMGAMSSADKETRILRLKAYLDQANPNGNGVNRYNSLTALKKAQLYSWSTFLTYLSYIDKHYYDSLTPQGLQNFAIAQREAEFLEKANRKAKKR